MTVIPEGWKEIKGTDLVIKVTQPAAAAVAGGDGGGDDDDDEEEAAAPVVKVDDHVLINLTGRRSDDPSHADGPVFQRATSWLVGVGDLHSLVKAVELGLQSMRQGETALIWSTAEYNFGPGGTRKYRAKSTDEWYELPADSSVLYEITVQQIVKDTSQLNPYFPIQKALTRKNIANDVYQHEWEGGGKPRERAIYLYERAAKDMDKLLNRGVYFQQVEENHPQRKQCQTVLVDCLNNLVAVYLRAKRYEKARCACKDVLKHDKHNAKAHLRYAKASVLDATCSAEDKKNALEKAEGEITYKDAEQVELKKLRAQFKRQQQQQ